MFFFFVFILHPFLVFLSSDWSLDHFLWNYQQKRQPTNVGWKMTASNFVEGEKYFIIFALTALEYFFWGFIFLLSVLFSYWAFYFSNISNAIICHEKGIKFDFFFFFFCPEEQKCHLKKKKRKEKNALITTC